MKEAPLSSSLIKAEAARLGFAACGLARVTPVDESTALAFNRWIADGNHADMDYMNRYGDARFHPESVLPGCRTIVSLALDYTPTEPISADRPQFAFYAYGPDYHETMKAKIRELAEAIRTKSEYSEHSEYSEKEFRIAVDTAPLLERYWAEQAGIGWIGRHHNLIIPGCGSFVNLGELLLTAKVDHYDQPIPNRCGTCHRCIDACPTGALSEGSIDARRCLSYLTIEHRGSFSPEQASLVRNQPNPKYIYGCDRCQLACPWNKANKVNGANKPNEVPLSATSEEWLSLTREQYQTLFRGSAVKRAKYEGLMRNIKTVLE